MACNCGSKSKATAWEFVSKDGSRKRYPTEIQARAAVVRAGGGRVEAVVGK